MCDAALHRFLAHWGLVTALVVLLVLSTPLVWLGASQGHFDPMLYAAVIEADVEFDAECNVSRQITSASGRQDRVAKLETLASEDAMLHSVSHARDMWTHLANKGWTSMEIVAFAQDLDLSSCVDHAGKFTTKAKLWRGWLNLMTFSSGTWETVYEPVHG